jgi:putative transport protein
MANLGELLAGQELLLLFLVILLGLLLGRLEFRGVRLGTAGVLFAGLGLSAWYRPTHELVLAPELKEFGLVLFVYCVGLTGGPGFFSAWRRGGLRMNMAVLVALLVGACCAAVGGRLLGLNRGEIAGVFCGALTNTPALGAASERLAGTALASLPALTYSLTYPFGVLGALFLARLYANRQHAALSEELARHDSSASAIESATIEVTNAAVTGQSIGQLRVRNEVGVVISRLMRGSEESVPTKYTVLQPGDVITVVGVASARRAATRWLGKPAISRLHARRDRVDMRRVLVSKRELIGKTLAELELAERFNAQVTRLRRADLDLVPSDEMRVELGDRLRVVAPAERLPELARFLGDSERELADVDYVALALGLCAGLLLSHVSLPLSGSELELGNAGGPLLAALVLGRLGRTGSLVWAMPHEANLGLRELGLLLFLSGVGLSAGGKLAGVLSLQGALSVGLGAVVTLVTTLVVLLAMTRWARTGVVSALGAASGLQTQPATLAAAFELTRRNEQTYVAYAVVYPLAMIGKILLAQMLALANWL